MADRPGRFEPPTAAPCSWTKSANCRCWCRPKLLRALQNGEIQRLGDDRPRRVDVRIVAATNRSLKDLVRDGDFRADLYHRLSVYPSPFRRCASAATTMLLLAGRYLEQNRARLGLRSLRLALDAEEALRRYRWPGNVRELEHVISRAAIKAVSRGANRNHIVTLEAGLLDLSGADLRPLAAAPDAPPATTPDGALATCATPWTPVSLQHVRLALQAGRQLARARAGGGPQQPAQTGAPAGRRAEGRALPSLPHEKNADPPRPLPARRARPGAGRRPRQGQLHVQGHPLRGKVQIVDAFPDIKIEVVTAFEDLRVERVRAFASAAANGEIVTAFPDFRSRSCAPSATSRCPG